jgi:hypothetical protein
MPESFNMFIRLLETVKGPFVVKSLCSVKCTKPVDFTLHKSKTTWSGTLLILHLYLPSMWEEWVKISVGPSVTWKENDKYCHSSTQQEKG